MRDCPRVIVGMDDLHVDIAVGGASSSASGLAHRSADRRTAVHLDPSHSVNDMDRMMVAPAIGLPASSLTIPPIAVRAGAQS